MSDEYPDPAELDPEVAALLDDRRVREFDPADTNVLRELFAQSIEYLTRDDYDEAQRLAWLSAAEDAEAFEDRLWDADTYIVEVETEIAGFATLKDDAVIDMLYVHPHFAGQGVGRKLVETLERLVRTRGKGEISVEASDTARPFFLRLGYEADKRQLVAREGQLLGRTGMKKSLS